MAWSGIWVIPLRPGETAGDAVSRTTLAWLELKEEGLFTVPNEEFFEAEPDDASDRWMAEVVALLRHENPRFEVTEERNGAGHFSYVGLYDTKGAVNVGVFCSEAQVIPRRGYQEPDDGPVGSGSHTMWQYIQLIASTRPCAAHDPDYGDIIDLELDEEEAAEIYNAWL